MSDILSKVLNQIGLSSFAIKAYTTLSLLDDPNITNLAKELSVDRAKIYATLIELEDAGLVQPRKSHSRFIDLVSPSILVQKLRKKELEAKNLSLELVESLPNLNFKFSNKKRSPLVKIYEGKTQFINLYNQVLEESGDKIEMFGNADEVYDLISFEYQLSWSSERIKKNIFSKLLVFHSHKLEQLNKKTYLNGKREIRWLPQDYHVPGSYWLFGNKTIHWNPVLPKAIVIEDKIATDCMRASFNFLWDMFEKNKMAV